MVIYLVLVGVVGYLSSRLRAISTKIDYFLAGRALKPFVLVFTLAFAQMSAFCLMGMAGLGYRGGFSIPMMFGTICLIFDALGIYVIGTRSWGLSKKFGYISPASLIGDRWQSRLVTYIVFALLLYYLIPYIELGAVGGGKIFASLTNNAVPYEIGAGIVIGALLFYIVTGGMRGMAWTNVVQGMIMTGLLIFMLLSFSIKFSPSGLTEKVISVNPKLLALAGSPHLPWGTIFSWFIIIGTSVSTFPHLILRAMSAENEVSLRKTIVAFGAVTMAVTYMSSFMGAWGRGLVPGLSEAQSEAILPILASKYFPAIVSGILGAGILAAAMSTMDGQVFAISVMFAEDIISPLWPKMTEAKSVIVGRLLVVAVCAIAFVLALFRPTTILRIGEWALSGYVCMGPAFVGALYWKRCSKWGAIASLVVPALLLPLFFLGYMPKLPFGLLPVVPALILSVALLVVVSLLSPDKLTRKGEEWFAFFTEWRESKERR